MKLIFVGLFFLLASSVYSASLKILSEYLCPLEMDSWNPVQIDSFQFMESGNLADMFYNIIKTNPLEREFLIAYGPEYSWELIYSWQPGFCDDHAYAFLPVCVISLQPGNNCNNSRRFV